MRKRLARLVPAVLALAVLTGFVVGTSSARTAAGSLTIYSGQHEETVQALVAAFEKQTGIDVSVRFDSEGSLVSQIVQEGSRSRADVFMTENSPPLEALAARGLLTKVDASTIGRTSARYSSPQRRWAAVSAPVSQV